MVKKTPKASLLVVYYAKLTEIFLVSASHLYHTYAWLNLFTIQKNFNKNLCQKDLQLIASSFVLAALSVCPSDHSYGTTHLELENAKERNIRVTNVIRFNVESRPESREVVILYKIDLVSFCNSITWLLYLSLQSLLSPFLVLQLSQPMLLSELVR